MLIIYVHNLYGHFNPLISVKDNWCQLLFIFVLYIIRYVRQTNQMQQRDILVIKRITIFVLVITYRQLLF